MKNSTAIYMKANGIEGKNPPITTERIFTHNASHARRRTETGGSMNALETAVKAVEIYAGRHPRPSYVTQRQTAEMQSGDPADDSKDGRSRDFRPALPKPIRGLASGQHAVRACRCR